MRELRRNKRYYVHNGARLAAADGSPLGECRVINVSRNGARIETKQASTMPDYVVLLLSRNGRLRRQCIVVWRSDTSLGLEFIPNVTAS
jgi:hypothetical protein